MKKILFIASFLLFTGCFDNLKLEEKEKIEDKVKEKEPKVEMESNKTVAPTTKKYTKEQLEVKEYFEAYLARVEALDVEGIISMTYPKLFDPINKNLFRQYVNSLVSSDQITVESFDTNITHIGKIGSYSKGKFVDLKYQSSIKLAFINPELYKDELSIRILDEILSNKYGRENIIIEPQDRTIVIKKEEKILGIKENDEEWKFIGDNHEYRRLYPQILPLDILSQI